MSSILIALAFAFGDVLITLPLFLKSLSNTPFILVTILFAVLGSTLEKYLFTKVALGTLSFADK